MIRKHMFRAVLIAILAFILTPVVTSAQQTQPTPPADVHEHVAVTAPLLTPTREASGTAWLPETTPMYGLHRPWRGWDVRLNGVAFAQGIYEPGDRHRTGGPGTRQAAGLSWGMAMARRSVGAGRFGVRTMVSADPVTVRGCGTLNYLSVGEVCGGDGTHDRQQPHDLVMELSVDYDRPLQGAWRWQVYAGLAGEPALGPPGYPHRASAMANPIRPMTHHWLDATHVAFGVVTVGVHNQRWKVEASAFKGRVPDESRLDLDLGAFDSAAMRLSFLLTDRWALQISGARLRDVATDFPFPAQDHATRFTASAMYNVPLGADGIWATTMAYGANHARERVAIGILDATSQAALLESSVTIAGRHTVFGRAELGDMPAHHLHAHEYSTSLFVIGKVQAGYVQHLRKAKGLVLGIGATAAISFVSTQLAPRYSGRTAPTYSIFVSLQAAKHQM